MFKFFKRKKTPVYTPSLYRPEFQKAYEMVDKVLEQHPEVDLILHYRLILVDVNDWFYEEGLIPMINVTRR